MEKTGTNIIIPILNCIRSLRTYESGGKTYFETLNFEVSVCLFEELVTSGYIVGNFLSADEDTLRLSVKRSPDNTSRLDLLIPMKYIRTIQISDLESPELFSTY